MPTGPTLYAACCAGPLSGPVFTSTDPRMYHFALPPAQTDLPPGQTDLPPDASVDSLFKERWYPGARRIAARATSIRRTGHPAGVRAIIIHATAGRSSAGAFSVTRAGRASFHWLVPHPSEAAHGHHVWATAPERRAAWHVANRASHPAVLGGATHINHASLGIEIVNAQDGRDPFSQWQVAVTASIVRYAWAKYPNLETVLSHAKLDPDRRSDPGPLFPWAAFRALVLGTPPSVTR